MFESEHARPFVLGMNGTFSGFFIPQMILLDPTPAQPALPTPAEAAGAPGLPELEALRAKSSAEDFVVAATAQRAAPNAPALPDELHFTTILSPQSAPAFDVFAFGFAWDAPALPVSDLHHWDTIVSAWFEPQPSESLGWDLFLY
jgi:hypothetical protein